MSLISLYTAEEFLRVTQRKRLEYDEVSNDVLLECAKMIGHMWDAVNPKDDKVFTFLLTLLLLGIEIGLNLPNKPNAQAPETYH